MFKKLLTGATAALVALPCLLAPAHTVLAAAGGNLDWSSTNTYDVDARSGVVHVVVDSTVTNNEANTVSGYTIYQHYFSSIAMPVPTGNARLVATQDGRAATVSFENSLSDSYRRLRVHFATNLFYRQTSHIRVAYDIVGLHPRSNGSSRVNAAYASFDAYGIGDPGKVTVTVIVPSGFVTDTFGATVKTSYETQRTIYTATNIAQPDTFDLFVSTRNDDALVSNRFALPSGPKFNVRAWPGDTAWRSFVATEIRKGLPVLTTLIGQPWPVKSRLDVIETITPYLYGYAGWYSAADGQIQMGENLEQDTALHELSHAWFSESWFAERWINEGLAQVYSNLAVGKTGGTPKKPEKPDTASTASVALLRWGDPKLTTGADATETWGYNASFWVMQQLLDEVGTAKMQLVFAAIADHTNAYDEDGETGALATPSSAYLQNGAEFERVLDLLDERAGSKQADALFTTYVLPKLTDTTDGWALKARAKSRTAYAALRTHGGTWLPPVGVRAEMGTWTFDAADAKMQRAEQVLVLRDKVLAVDKQLGITMPDSFRLDYEKVSDADFSKVSKELQAHLDAANAILAATATVHGGHGLFTTIGLWGSKPQDHVTRATAALWKDDVAGANAESKAAVDAVGNAKGKGELRSGIAGAALLLLMGGAGFVLLHRRRVRTAAAVASNVTDAAGWAPPIPPLPPAPYDPAPTVDMDRSEHSEGFDPGEPPTPPAPDPFR